MLLLLLAACATGDVDALPTRALAPPALSAPARVRNGERLDLRLTGAPADATWALVATDGGLGPGGCPAVLGGACLDILRGRGGYRVVAEGVARPDGSADIGIDVPAVAAPGVYQLQLTVLDPVVELSAPIELEVEPGCDDAFEPNDSPAAAIAMGAGPTPLGVCPGDRDWFTLTVPAQTTLEVVADFDARDGDLDLELYAANGVRLDGSYRVTAPETLAWYNGDAVAQDVQVFAFSRSDPQANGVRYELTVDALTAAPCVGDAAEPDDDAATAVAAVLGLQPTATACAGDEDWRWIDLAADELVVAEVSSPPEAGVARVRLVDDAGAPLSPDGPRARYGATAPQRVWIVTALDYDDVLGGGAPYDLEVAIQRPRPCRADAFEPNDDPATATSLSPGRWTDLDACADDDLFALTLTAGQPVSIRVEHRAVDGNIDALLTDPTGATLGWSRDVDDTDEIDVIPLLSGVHLLRLSLVADPGGGVTGGARYDLDLTF